MEVRVNLATNSYPYIKSDAFSDLKGIVVCTTKAQDFKEFFADVNRSGLFGNKCPHYYIDNSGSVYQVLPENYRAKFAGKKCDENYIQIVLQEPNGIKYDDSNNFFVPDVLPAKVNAMAQYHALVKLCATITVKHSLEPKKTGVIISHREAFLQKMAVYTVGIEQMWKALSMDVTMTNLRNDIVRNITDGKGFYHNGVDYSFVFDPSYYGEMYPEIGAECNYEGSKLFRHFIEYGMNHCLRGRKEFDVAVYIANNPDLSFGDRWSEYYTHYCSIGRLEDRTCE